MIYKSFELPVMPQGMMGFLEVVIPYLNDNDESAWYRVIEDCDSAIKLAIYDDDLLLWLNTDHEEMMWVRKDDLASVIAEWVKSFSDIVFHDDTYDALVIPAFPHQCYESHTLVFHPYGYLQHLEQVYFESKDDPYRREEAFEDFLHLLKCLNRTADAALLKSLKQIPENFYNDYIAE